MGKVLPDRSLDQELLRRQTTVRARGGESHGDFVHKLSIVLKELNETKIWLRIIEQSGMIEPRLLDGMIEENRKLCQIFTSSLKTARTRKK